MPSASGTVTIARGVDDVFAFVADGTNDPRWRPGVVDVALASGSGVGARYRQGVRGPGGRRIAADYEITAFEPGNRLAFQATAGPVRPHGGYRFEPVAEGTRITFSLAVDLSGLKRLLMARSVQGAMDGEVAALANLKRVLETG
jgi:uncharacterized protein YndB with AHSA1/START domain